MQKKEGTHTHPHNVSCPDFTNSNVSLITQDDGSARWQLVVFGPVGTKTTNQQKLMWNQFMQWSFGGRGKCLCACTYESQGVCGSSWRETQWRSLWQNGPVCLAASGLSRGTEKRDRTYRRADSSSSTDTVRSVHWASGTREASPTGSSICSQQKF